MGAASGANNESTAHRAARAYLPSGLRCSCRVLHVASAAAIVAGYEGGWAEVRRGVELRARSLMSGNVGGSAVVRAPKRPLCARALPVMPRWTQRKGANCLGGVQNEASESSQPV